MVILLTTLFACADNTDVTLPSAPTFIPTSTVPPTTTPKPTSSPTLEPTSTPTSTTDTIPDACHLQADESMQLIEQVHATMPPPPPGAELLYQGRIESCGPYQHYGLWNLYGFNQPEFNIQEYYWDRLSVQGWLEYRTMSTGPRPIFCHPDYNSIEVDAPHDWAMHFYDPPAPENLLAKAKENYQILFSVEVSHWPSESPIECTKLGILP